MKTIQFFADNEQIFLILHVLCVIIGMGSALVADLLFNFYSKNRILNSTERKTLNLLFHVIWISLLGIILSGGALFFSNPEYFAHSQKFISKMLLVVVLLINELFLHIFVSPHFADRGLLKFKDKRRIRQYAFASGAISVLSWLTIMVLGMLSGIPFTALHFFMLYVFVAVCVVGVVLAIEKKQFKRR